MFQKQIEFLVQISLAKQYMRTYLHIILKASVFLLCFSKEMLNSCYSRGNLISLTGIEFVFQNFLILFIYVLFYVLCMLVW